MQTIVNLRIISCLKPGERICTRDTMWRVVPPSVREAIGRWLFGDNRQADLERIRNLYEHATREIADAQNRHIIQASLRGLEALRSTYKNDITSRCQIDQLISSVKYKCGLCGENDGEIGSPCPSGKFIPPLNPQTNSTNPFGRRGR